MNAHRLRTAVVLAASAAVSVAALAQPAPASAQRAVLAGRVLHVKYQAKHQATNHSLNWSGYIQSGKAITASAASWHVPTLTGKAAGYSSTWVGIDGATSGDQYLIQTGTEADLASGKAEYHAWWEVITPTDEAPETLFSTLTVHAGDSIHAAVTKLASGKWSMTLRDYTTGKTATHTATFGGPGSSAEWIQEDTDVNGYISAAPDWRSVTFTGITVNGANPALKTSQAVQIVDSKGTQEDAVSAPNTTHDGFVVSWLAAGTRTYVG